MRGTFLLEEALHGNRVGEIELGAGSQQEPVKTLLAADCGRSPKPTRPAVPGNVNKAVLLHGACSDQDS